MAILRALSTTLYQSGEDEAWTPWRWRDSDGGDHVFRD